MKELKISQNDLVAALRKMQSSNQKCPLALIYTLDNGATGLLVRYDFKYSQVLNEVTSIARKGFLLKPVFENW
jgi:hypothetical protein